jgi:hypothetical protein
VTGQIDAGVKVTARIRIRRTGRQRVVGAQPGLFLALDTLVKPECRVWRPATRPTLVRKTLTASFKALQNPSLRS